MCPNRSHTAAIVRDSPLYTTLERASTAAFRTSTFCDPTNGLVLLLCNLGHLSVQFRGKLVPQFHGQQTSSAPVVRSIPTRHVHLRT